MKKPEIVVNATKEIVVAAITAHELELDYVLEQFEKISEKISQVYDDCEQ